MTTLIGHTGMIGQTLQDQHCFDRCYNSGNIESLTDHSHDLVICSAPSGNRLLINSDPGPDQQNLNCLTKVIAHTKIKKFVLISSVDAINYPNTPYGKNRLMFESFVQEHIPDSHIVRLSSLVGKNIKKNMLYDLKHQMYLEHVNPAAKIQWYDLKNLWSDIDLILNLSVRTHNFVSEPIQNQEIIDQFFPTSQVGSEKETPYCDLRPHWVSKQHIFSAIKEYLQ
jgi:hypothetical protein